MGTSHKTYTPSQTSRPLSYEYGWPVNTLTLGITNWQRPSW